MANIETSHGSRRLQLLSLLCTTLLVSIALKLVTLPTSRILENRYCLAYYAQHDPSLIGQDGTIEESLCKIDAIQKQLGWMSGLLETTTLACDILSTAPLAYAADHIGRQRVLLLNLLAMAFKIVWTMLAARPSIPDSILLLGPLLSIFGGGISVSTANLLAITSSTAKSDSERPVFISWFNSAQFSSSLLGPALASLLMASSLWLPLWTAISMLLLPICFIHVLPDLRASASSLRRRMSDDVSESTSLVADGRDDPLTGNVQDREQRSLFANAHRFVHEYWSLISASSRFKLVLISFFLTGVASSSSILFPLLLTKRFGWTFAEVGVIYSFKAIVNLTMSLVVVPYYSSHNVGKTQIASDQLACRLSLMISAIGAIMVALASSKWMALFSLCIYAIGSVVSTFMYSISRKVGFDQYNESRGYALIVLAHELGRLIATPLMTTVWSIVLGQSSWLGVPFVISAVAYTLCLLTMSKIDE